MQNPNLASIEVVKDTITDFATNAETFSYEAWFPELQKWNTTLQLACRELKGYFPYANNEFNLLRKELKKEILQLQDEIKLNCSTVLQILDDKEIIEGVYQEIIMEIDSLNDLNGEDLLIILYATLEKFLERVEINDYSEFYELACIDETTHINATTKKKTSLSNKQYGWIFALKKEDTSRGKITNLIKEYNIPNKSLDIKDNLRFYMDCLEVGTEYQRINGIKTDVPPTVEFKQSIEDNLKVALQYFVLKNEPAAINETNKFLEKHNHTIRVHKKKAV